MRWFCGHLHATVKEAYNAHLLCAPKRCLTAPGCLRFTVRSLEEAVIGAVAAALHSMPAAVDFCLCFVATPGRSAADRQALQQVVPWCQARLPAGECGGVRDVCTCTMAPALCLEQHVFAFQEAV